MLLAALIVLDTVIVPSGYELNGAVGGIKPLQQSFVRVVNVESAYTRFTFTGPTSPTIIPLVLLM